MKKFEALIISAELIRELNILDCNVIVCDPQGKIVHHIPAKTFNDNVDVGGTIKNDSVQRCLSTKKKINNTIPEGVFGVKLKTTICPIFEEDGTFSGVLGTATNVNVQGSLSVASQSIASTSEEISATTEELSSSALNLAKSLLQIRSSIENVISEINKTDDILKFVDHIADNSNMLGINAAIEAARAGEQGKGFAVVADKIREMAENSTDSVKNIRKIIVTIQKEIKSLVNIVDKTVELGQQQASATEEIESVMQQLATTASDVEKIAEII
jgi:methyl-accepting chemotaxis protein